VGQRDETALPNVPQLQNKHVSEAVEGEERSGVAGRRQRAARGVARWPGARQFSRPAGRPNATQRATLWRGAAR